MDERLRAASIVEIAQRGDMALLKSFAYDMIVNAKSEERERCAQIAESELCSCKVEALHDGCCGECGKRIAQVLRAVPQASGTPA